MPAPYLNKVADKTGIDINTLEKKWEEAKKITQEKYAETDSQYWPYVMGVFKKSLGKETLQKVESSGIKVIIAKTVDNIL